MKRLAGILAVSLLFSSFAHAERVFRVKGPPPHTANPSETAEGLVNCKDTSARFVGHFRGIAEGASDRYIYTASERRCFTTEKLCKVWTIKMSDIYSDGPLQYFCKTYK